MRVQGLGYSVYTSSLGYVAHTSVQRTPVCICYTLVCIMPVRSCRFSLGLVRFSVRSCCTLVCIMPFRSCRFRVQGIENRVSSSRFSQRLGFQVQGLGFDDTSCLLEFLCILTLWSSGFSLGLVRFSVCSILTLRSSGLWEQCVLFWISAQGFG